MSHDILDLPADKPKRHTFSVMAYGAMVLMLAGMTFKLMHWPLANLLVLIGGSGLVLRNVLVVAFNRPVIWKPVFYYLGYSLLVAGMVGVWLNRGDFFRYLIVAAVAMFFVQFLWPRKKIKGA